VIFGGVQEIQRILGKPVYYQIFTVSTKGQSMRRHLPQSFGSEHNLLYFTAKTSNLTPPELMKHPG